MTERYDQETARHYAAYRPPLHRLILQRLVDPTETFRSGLDFGCGTGYSTIELSVYCDHVYGVDVSQEMLDLAEPHPNATYRLGSAEMLTDMSGQPFDVVTMAGSLVYAKSDALRKALLSICRSEATVLVYDFKVLIDKLMDLIGLTMSEESLDYDYDLGLQDWGDFKEIVSKSDRVSLQMTAEQAAHILLSDSYQYDLIVKALGNQEVFQGLVSRFEAANIKLEADIWYKRYQLVK